ncbi:MAG TPA: YoaK family protein [Acidimicrobiales bacterium]|nr:YoaK family protein [Acidimicrobiales bacterium]
MTPVPMEFRQLPAARRGTILLGLTLVAGCTDAISYLGLGRVFTANMTGNTVLLGLAVAQRDAGAAARSAAALGGFVIGAVVVSLAPELTGTAAGGAGVPAARRRPGTGPRPGRRSRQLAQVTGSLVIELGLLAALLGWWSTTGSTPHGAAQDGLISLAGTAMGVQSAAVARLGVPGVATTYITGTWTGISAGVANWIRRRPPDVSPEDGPHRGLQVTVVVVYLGGAIAGGFGHDGWGPAAAAIPLGVLAVVVAAISAKG